MHARETAHSHARRHMRNPLNSSHARSAAAGVSHRICKTLALLPPACAVMGSSAGSSAAQKSHASERRQSSTARIGTLKSTIASKETRRALSNNTSGIEPLGQCRATTGVDQELSCRELGSATRKQARPTQRNSEVEEQEFCKMCETYKRCCASSAESYIHAHRCLILVHGV